MSAKEAILLVGHGGIPADAPKAKVAELKRLESERQARGERVMSAREAELDREIREWPRTPATDPYKYGVEEIARALAPKLGGRKLAVAYNEFCAPSVESALDALIAEGVTRVQLVCTMYTRGGIHAEKEIPDIVEDYRRRHPGLSLEYAWPYDPSRIADFLAAQLS